MGLFSELKRRNVFRVGVAYIVGAWLLAQVADLVLDVIGAPDIVLRSLVVLLGLGLVPAVIFAWVFEITPEGVKRESSIDRSQSITQETGKKLNVATIVMVIAAVSFVIFERYLPRSDQAASVTPAPAAQSPERVGAPETPVSVNDKSIAVLPFANRSNQQDDLFFTDGIHDDLLTQLAKIHDLDVISRTSVMDYRDTRKNVKQIGAELNVATILEGGIQKVGDRVRINAQLIEVATDRHLWAETFDRELTAENIFDIQSEIAHEIVKAIAVELTPEEEQRLSEKPTDNLVAYEAYLKGREIFYGANYARSQETSALPWFEKAVELDPEYAEAHAMLANIYGQLYWRGLNTSEEFLDQYRATIDRALEINPNSPMALRASANYHYRAENDYVRSLALVEQALEGAPGDVDLHGDRALNLRRLGRWDESIESFRTALKIDPGNEFYRGIMIETMGINEMWQEIVDSTVPLEDADPDDLDEQVARGISLFNLSGDLEPLERTFEKMNLTDSTRYITWSARTHWLQRDYDAVIEVLNNPIWTVIDADAVFQNSRDFELANAYRMMGDEERANEHFDRVISSRDKVMTSSLQVQIYGGTTVAIALARRGRFQEALDLAELLVRENPQEKDAMLHGFVLASRAMVRGLTGDEEGAIEDLSRSLKIRHAFKQHPWDLHLDPNWDFMRDNPRFVELATPATVIRTVEP